MKPSIHGASRHVLAAALALAPLAASAEVFINEIHYDNTGSDTGERIEVVATAGENLASYRLYLYNGATPSAATYYDNDLLPTGSTVSCGGSVRIATLSYAANGVQNGANDGVALVNGSGQVVQFLSYEGTITGSNGPAAGRTSSNLAVAENESPSNTSLQLGGTGSGYANFTWRASATQTFGACNNAQTFAAPNPPPTVVSTSPTDGATGVAPATDLATTFSEAVTLAGGAFALQCTQSGAVSLTYPASGTGFTITTGATLAGGEACTFTIDATKVTDGGGAKLAQNKVIGFTVAASGGTGYYAHVNTTSASQLRCSLHETIKNHTAYPYSGGTTNTWSILEIADEDPNNAGRILDVYRNRSYLKGSERAGTGTGLTYNREHTWPNSLGFGSTTGDKGLPYSPYTDTHMLYLSDTTWNADRGNKPYADCTLASGCGERITEANNGFGGGNGVYPGNSNWVKGPDGNAGSFQPWGHRKGDIARAVLYMAIRYEGGIDQNGQTEPDLELTDDRSKIVITSASPAYMGLLSTLLAWHQADPPDAGERERNEVIYSFQGNRNPFVDHPEWATSALFASTQPASCQLN
ncbi:endonuclease [Lysobacter solisilvae (ex Woo and Kim 2020)]|uniref:Endonuclease n=1 Tax=Agrilutibacter terrestris TaxID=2865112 RepID=A0A7H0FZV4_9GAMM|nr:endonuclease [Lysobacter terrestris]QNP41570.1 endonuclease [Lysobacter terrestris]